MSADSGANDMQEKAYFCACSLAAAEQARGVAALKQHPNA
jgi:hypothetical protein